MVKDTIERIGGSVELVNGEPGATFRLHVPVTAEEPSPEPVVLTRVVPQPGMAEQAAILFVDDEFQSRNAWSLVLREAGHIVHVASSGAEALAAINAGNHYEICVLDYRMPEMNRIELATAIREREPAMSLIAISADIVDDKTSIFANALETGLLDGALQKPLHPATLLSTIQRLRRAPYEQQLDTTPTYSLSPL